MIGVSGNDDDNPFAPPRSKPFPLPQFDLSYDDQIIAERLGRAGISIHTTPQARTRLQYDGRPGCQNFGVCRYCPIGVRYSPNHHLKKSIETGLCDLHTETSVRRLIVDGAGNATGVLVQRNDETSAREHSARIVVVAAGGLETPRLMLLSTDQQSEGVGNGYGQVGRNFVFHNIWGRRV